MTDRIDRELVLDAPIDDVWQALTDRGWLTRWLADEVTLELCPGGEARFQTADSVRSGWVEEVSPPRRLAFWWAEANEPASRVELELSADEDGRTRLRVTETRPLELLDLIGLRLPGPGGGTYGPALVAG